MVSRAGAGVSVRLSCQGAKGRCLTGCVGGQGPPGKEESEDAEERYAQPEEDGARARDEADAAGDVDEGAGEARDELGRVLVGEGELEREGGEDDAAGEGYVDHHRQTAEAAYELAVKPEVCDGHQHPEQHGVGVQVELDEIRFSSKLLARLIPAPDEPQGKERNDDRGGVAHPRTDVPGRLR